MINGTVFTRLLAAAKVHYPKLRVVPKEDSKLMAVLAALLFFVKDFKTGYATTVGYTVYMPRATIAGNSAWQTLAHELVHVHDWHTRKVWFALGYLFPQVLAAPILALSIGLAWVSPHFLWGCLIAAAALAPWPAPWRMKAERRGYAATLLCGFLNGFSVFGMFGLVQEQFEGWAYYKMWPFRRSNELWLATVADAVQFLRSDEKQFFALYGDLPYRMVVEAVNGSGEVRANG